VVTRTTNQKVVSRGFPKFKSVLERIFSVRSQWWSQEAKGGYYSPDSIKAKIPSTAGLSFWERNFFGMVSDWGNQGPCDPFFGATRRGSLRPFFLACPGSFRPFFGPAVGACAGPLSISPWSTALGTTSEFGKTCDTSEVGRRLFLSPLPFNPL